MKKRTTMLALLLATGAGTCLQAQEKLTQFKVRDAITVRTPIGITPFVIIPADNFRHSFADHHRRQTINDRTQRTAIVISGNQRQLIITHNAF